MYKKKLKNLYSFIIKLAHGFVLIPLIFAFKKKKIFNFIKKPKTLNQIVNFTKLNSGFVNSGLKLLLTFSVIKKRKNFYFLGNRKLINLINNDFVKFYNYDFKEILYSKKNLLNLEKYSSKIINGWNIKSCPNEILSGPFLIPIIFSLKLNKKYLKKINSKQLKNLKKIFISYNWIKIPESSKPVLTFTGRYLLDNINTIGVIASYRKMLSNITFLLEEDPKKFFLKNYGSENHIDRKLNIESSSDQHNKYFNEILNIIELIFKRKNKPKYIMDIGCGDGLLLKKIYKKLESFLLSNELKKIKMIGVDLNNTSIQKAKKNLFKIPTIFIKNNIDEPEKIFRKLKKNKIDSNLILHVRSFIDHERHIKIWYKKAYHERDIINLKDPDVDGVDENGKNIETQIINKSLDEFYMRWVKYIGKFGLINLEVFKQSLSDMKKNLDLNEGAHFDFIQTFSGQNLCKAEMQLYCMAKNSLLPKIIKTYPTTTKFKRILLGYFVKEKFYINIFFKKFKKFEFFLVKKKSTLHLRQERIKAKNVQTFLKNFLIFTSRPYKV